MRSLFTPQETRVLVFIATTFLLGLAVRQCRKTQEPALVLPSPRTVELPEPGNPASDWDE